MDEKCTIVGLKIDDRIHHANDLQKVLTNYGCYIKTRMGLHKLHDAEGSCSKDGIVILHLWANQETVTNLMYDLSEIEGICAKNMMFD